MDYNNMKKSHHSRSREYLATVIQDREGVSDKTYHFKRTSGEQIELPLHLQQQKHIYANKSHALANQYQQQKIRPFHQTNQQQIYLFQKYPNRSKIKNTISNGTMSLLKERLQNIHHHYEALVGEQKQKNRQRTEIILDLLDEMQQSHKNKIFNLQKTIKDVENEKKAAGMVDQKMSEIKLNIEQLISQSAAVKEKNEFLTKAIQERRKNVDAKQYQLEKVKDEVLETRQQLQQFQIKNIKNNRANKQIIEIFKTASTVSESK